MASKMLRISVLLLVFSFVGLVGLTGSANPGGVRIAHAASVEIQLSSNGAAALDFDVLVLGCPNALAPGDTCTAAVTVTNIGTQRVTLTAPAVADSGVLDTCSGNDPNNPGTGNNNLSSDANNLSYTPNVTFVAPSGSVTFSVAVSLDMATPNACQDKQGQVFVQVFATDDDLVVLPPGIGSPGFTPAGNPDPRQGAGDTNEQPVSEVSNSNASNSSDSNGGQGRPGFVSEVLPARFPATGHGYGDGLRDVAEMLFVGIALLGAGLMLAALLALQNRRRAR